MQACARLLTLLVLALPSLAQRVLPDATKTPRILMPADGFHVEVAAEGFGSLILVSTSPTGDVVVSSLEHGLLRLLDEDADGAFESAERFCPELAGCQGLHFMPDGTAYAMGRSSAGTGVHRLPPSPLPRKAELVVRMAGGMGEHGPHAILPAADGRLLLVVGNHAQPAQAVAASSPCDTIYEGHPLPRIEDPNGHAHGIRAPGGSLLLWDPATGVLERFAAGFRNAYDACVDDAGAIFTFDSDMEWEIGLPWHRQVRLVHAVPGGDYGWRAATAKSPAHHADTLPAMAEAGRGSPTGVLWCDSPRFSTAFRRTILAADWSQGRVLAFSPRAAGATYTATSQVLLAGRPLPVTDLAWDKDQRLLVSLGGRGLAGALLRMEAVKPGGPPAVERAETLLTFSAKTGLPELVAALSNKDRTQRFLAARELGRRPAAELEGIVRSHPLGAVRAQTLLALARKKLAAVDASGVALAADCLALLEKPEPVETRLAAARALQLALCCAQPETLAAEPRPIPREDLAQRIAALLPTGIATLDRDLSLSLAHCGGKSAEEKLLALHAAAMDPEEAIHLLLALANHSTPLAADALPPLMKHLGALKSRAGGHSYVGFLEAIQRRLLQAVAAPEHAALYALAQRSEARRVEVGGWKRERARVRDYLVQALDAPDCDVQEGARVFQRQCAACHQRGGLGRAGGPDLASVEARLGLDDLLIAIMEPSRHISDQYKSHQVFTRDQRLITGLVTRDDGARVEILDREGLTHTLATSDIDERRLSPLSAMPDGLLDPLTPIEVRDLVSFLLCANPQAGPLDSVGPWRPLLHQGLAGCEGRLDLWSLEAGVLKGTGKDLTRNEFLVLPGRWRDFQFECEVLLPTGNSGVQFRSTLATDGSVRGLQADLGDVWWGSLYDEGGRGVLSRADNTLTGPSLDRAAWNHLFVSAHGPKIRIRLNGLETVVLRDESPGDRLALQVHQGAPMMVSFRHLRLRD
jgi:putative heme-binding domain-containing protein